MIQVSLIQCIWYLAAVARIWHVLVRTTMASLLLIKVLLFSSLVVCGDPTSPVYSGEIQAPALGMAIDILDCAKDQPVSIQRTGEPGELVCCQPFPSEPVEFWGKDGTTKYQRAYFERFGNTIWTQGDFVSSSPLTGGFTMLGRRSVIVEQPVFLVDSKCSRASANRGSQ